MSGDKKKTSYYDSIIATRIRKIVHEHNLKYTKLAQESGIDGNQWSRYGNGDSRPSIEIIPKIANALNVSSDYLLGLSEEERPANSKKELNTCEDAINLISELLRIDGSFLTVIPDEEMGDGWIGPSIRLGIYEPGIVKYYQGIEKVNKAIKDMPETLSFTALQFQFDSTQQLIKEARKTTLHKKSGYIQVDDDELPF